MLLINGAQIGAGTFGGGNGGNLNIRAKDIQLIGVSAGGERPSGIFVQTEGEGDAGDLNIETDLLRLDEGSVISAATLEQGNGGNLTIAARDVQLIGVTPNGRRSTGLFVTSIGEKNAGKLTITTKNLLINEGATVTAASTGMGNSGNIEIFADRIDILDDSSIAVNNTGVGISGNIEIQGNSLDLDRGIINAESNIGRGGNISIHLQEVLNLTNSSTITAEAGIDRIGVGNGGNIEIDSPLIIASPENNTIGANAFGGSGGNINITANAILGYPQFLNITASSERSIDGTVNLNGLSDEIIKVGLETASIFAIDASVIIANDICALKNDRIADGSSFTIPGKGGITPSPLKSVDRNRGILEWTKITRDKFNSSKKDPSLSSASLPLKPKKFQPAVGWYRHEDGTVVLTSNPKEVRSLNEPVAYPNSCLN